MDGRYAGRKTRYRFNDIVDNMYLRTDTHKYKLYVLLLNEEPLYVGITERNIYYRFADHIRKAYLLDHESESYLKNSVLNKVLKMCESSTKHKLYPMAINVFKTKEEALKAETEAIKNFVKMGYPILNVQKNEKRKRVNGVLTEKQVKYLKKKYISRNKDYGNKAFQKKWNVSKQTITRALKA